MESLLILAVLVVIGLPVATGYLLFAHARLKQRVAALEAQLVAGAPAAQTPAPRAGAVPPPLPARTPPVAPPPLPAGSPVAAGASAARAPSGGIVVNARNAARIVTWVMQNWFYVVSAASLALAGIFLVIYGAEQGLMPPAARIALALVLGAGLVVGAEVLRRRFGDHAGVSTAYLPSTLASAGIVTLFGAILAARQLYGFIGPELALAGLAAVAAVAIVLGWFYGPLLAAVGVLGATLAPFVIGGASDSPAILLAYFLIVALAGLSIDTLRRWGWISILSLVCGFGAGTLLTQSGDPLVQAAFAPFVVLLALAAIAIPVRSLTPRHDGPPLSLSLTARGEGRAASSFPVRLAGAAVASASGLIALTAIDTTQEAIFWSGVLGLTLLALALILWARHAPALADLAALPAAALLVMVATNARIWLGQTSTPGTSASDAAFVAAPTPKMATILIVLATLISLAAAWRSLRGGQARVFMAALAGLFAPALAVTVELAWQPAATLGPFAWALHALMLAAIMVGLAERFARADGPDDRLRMSFAVLSALSCVTFAMVIFFTSAALTTAIVVAVVVAAALDRRFDLPLMGVFILAGVVATGFRLVVDPGLIWAAETSWPQMVFVHGGAVLAFAATWRLVVDAARQRLAILMESAVFSTTGIFLTLVIVRGAFDLFGDAEADVPWLPGVTAVVWLILGMTQLRRLEMGGPLRLVRMVLGAVFLLIAGIAIVGGVALGPLWDDVTFRVAGPMILNTLILAYLLPAVVLLWGDRWLVNLPRRVRLGFRVAGLALLTFWAGLAIRHAWRGPDAMALPGAGQGELITYTIAILLVGAGLFYQSLARRSASLRRAGLVVIGLAVVKVFLVDIGETNGLVRVGALLVLGLSLAGLAWLNRWAAGRTGPSEMTADP